MEWRISVDDVNMGYVITAIRSRSRPALPHDADARVPNAAFSETFKGLRSQLRTIKHKVAPVDLSYLRLFLSRSKRI